MNNTFAKEREEDRERQSSIGKRHEYFTVTRYTRALLHISLGITHYTPGNGLLLLLLLLLLPLLLLLSLKFNFDGEANGKANRTAIDIDICVRILEWHKAETSRWHSLGNSELVEHHFINTHELSGIRFTFHHFAQTKQRVLIAMKRLCAGIHKATLRRGRGISAAGFIAIICAYITAQHRPAEHG